MTELQTKHPLHGVGVEAMLTALVAHYDWPILAEQIPLKCFSTYPSIRSSVKFLQKTRWARERVEAFYLYRFKNISLPTQEQHRLPPREREIILDELGKEPAKILEGDAEFFDDPITGPVFPSKDAVRKSSSRSKESRARNKKTESPKTNSVEDINEPTLSDELVSEPKSSSKGIKQPSSSSAEKGDPWAKWRS